jgi:hypothetical protein
MGWLSKKRDPITARAQSLNSELAELEGKIRRLNTQIHQAQSQPRLRSTALPAGAHAGHSPPAQHDPVFEPVDQKRHQAAGDEQATPAHFNELGARKLDLAGLWRRLMHHLRGPPASNPKLVNYLAAGAIQGLRPLRYEKRVARNRLVGLTALLALILYGIIYALLRR